MDRAKQIIYNQIFDVARELVEDALYDVQYDVEKHFEAYNCDAYELDIDFDVLADKITESVIDGIIKG